MDLPPLPHSPYLYTEWTAPGERVARTMYPEETLQAYASECIRQAVEECNADWTAKMLPIIKQLEAANQNMGRGNKQIAAGIASVLGPKS